MRSTEATLQVAIGGGRGSVLAGDVYFAFPSGGLGYDCVSCGAQCCKGHGYLASSDHELLYQLKMRPQIAVFVTRGSASSNQRLVSNCPPGCFFLSAGGQCQVQDEFGYDAKPETCRLFPFNQFRMVGKYLVVSPHAYLCPLSVSPPGNHRMESDHAALTRELVDRGIRAPVEKWTPSHPYNPDALIKLERQIVAVAERYRDTGTYSDFLQEQVELALATEQSVSRPQTIIAAVLDGIRELFGLRQADLPARDDEVDRVMATMTPFLRAQLVLSPLSATGQVASSFPVDRVPHVLATLYILGLCARQSGMAKVTFQTISRLYQQDAHLLKLCAHFDAFVSISKDRPVDFPVLTDANQRSSFLRIVKSLIHNRTASSPLSLGAVLGAEIRGEVQERMHFLRQVATTLPTSLIELPSDKSVSPGPLKSRVSAAFQRISISLPDELLLAAYNRKMDATITSQG